MLSLGLLAYTRLNHLRFPSVLGHPLVVAFLQVVCSFRNLHLATILCVPDLRSDSGFVRLVVTSFGIGEVSFASSLFVDPSWISTIPEPFSSLSVAGTQGLSGLSSLASQTGHYYLPLLSLLFLLGSEQYLSILCLSPSRELGVCPSRPL